MKCLHGLDIIEKNILGVSIYIHAKKNTYCKQMNSEVDVDELANEFVFKNEKEKFAFVGSSRVQSEIIELLKEKKKAKLIIYMKKHRIFLKHLCDLMLATFGESFYFNVKELKLFDIDKVISENKNKFELERYSRQAMEVPMIKIGYSSFDDLIEP